MRNRIDLFLLFRLIVITLSLLVSFWCVYLLSNFTKASEFPPTSPAQALTLDKHKRQKNPPEEQEAQPMPWAHKLENVTVTYYDCCVACCGKDDGITYSGARAIPYETCAVDPDVIPLGSTVTVDYGDEELHRCLAEDIGGGVKGNRIDICVSSHQEAMEMGRRTATVYWMGGDELVDE